MDWAWIGTGMDWSWIGIEVDWSGVLLYEWTWKSVWLYCSWRAAIREKCVWLYPSWRGATESVMEFKWIEVELKWVEVDWSWSGVARDWDWIAVGTWDGLELD